MLFRKGSPKNKLDHKGTICRYNFHNNLDNFRIRVCSSEKRILPTYAEVIDLEKAKEDTRKQFRKTSSVGKFSSTNTSFTKPLSATYLLPKNHELDVDQNKTKDSNFSKVKNTDQDNLDNKNKQSDELFRSTGYSKNLSLGDKNEKDKKKLRVFNFYGDRLNNLSNKNGYKEYLKSNLFCIKGNQSNIVNDKRPIHNKIPFGETSYNKIFNDSSPGLDISNKIPGNTYITKKLGLISSTKSYVDNFKISPVKKFNLDNQNSYKSYYSNTKLHRIRDADLKRDRPCTNRKNVVEIDNLKIDEDNFIQKLRKNPIYKKLDKQTQVGYEIQEKSRKIFSTAMKVREKYFTKKEDILLNSDGNLQNINKLQKDTSYNQI